MRIYANDWKLFVFLRKQFKIEKPIALEWGKWSDWEKEIKSKHPFGYFVTETVPDFINDVARYIPTPISNIRYYCRNRFIRQSHVLPTKLPRGEYFDLDTRILHGIMESIVDFVEIELAYKSRWCGTEESKKARWRKGRCPELGLEYLNWEMTLDDPSLDEYSRSTTQAFTAREIKAIYDWWKITRPARPDPYDVSGWTEICEERRQDNDWFKTGSKEYEQRKQKSLKMLRKLEKQYEKEDQDMLMRVIKIRKSLWA